MMKRKAGEESEELDGNEVKDQRIEEDQEREEEEKEQADKEAVYTEIKGGYRLTIDSWENDLDHPYRFTEDGYSQEDVEFIIKFCRLFQRRQPFSNLYEPTKAKIKELTKALLQLIEENKPHSYHVLKDFGIDEELVNQTSVEEDNYDEFMDAFSQDWSPHFFSNGDSNFPFFTRVCDQIKVEYVPETIRILDVSRRFGVGR
jgi:hypothetical protein